MTHDVGTVLSKATYWTFDLRRGSYWTRRHTKVRIKTMHAITVYLENHVRYHRISQKLCTLSPYISKTVIHVITVYLKNYSRYHRISQKLVTLSPYISKTIHATTVYLKKSAYKNYARYHRISLKNHARYHRISQKLCTLSPYISKIVIHAITVYLKNDSRYHRISQKLFTLSPYISRTIHAITVKFQILKKKERKKGVIWIT